jgi:predicted MFS family arabinose efflux permease
MLTTVLMRVEGGAPRTIRTKKSSLFGDLGEGFAYVGRNPNLAIIVALAMILFVFGFPYQQFFIPLLAKDILEIGDAGVGWLMAATGAGALTGSVFVAARTRFDRPALQMVLNLIVFACTLLTIAVLAGVLDSRALATAVIAILLAIAGAMTVTFMSFTNTLLLANSDAEMHGRVTSLLSLDRGLIPVGAILAGTLTATIGTLPALFAMASLVLALSLAALLLWGRRLAAINNDERPPVPEGGPAAAPVGRRVKSEV